MPVSRPCDTSASLAPERHVPSLGIGPSALRKLTNAPRNGACVIGSRTLAVDTRSVLASEGCRALYVALSASVGLRRDALDAGYTPARVPITRPAAGAAISA